MKYITEYDYLKKIYVICTAWSESFTACLCLQAMGLSDEAAEQITGAYGKQAKEKINKVNSMIEFAAKQIKIEQEDFLQ